MAPAGPPAAFHLPPVAAAPRTVGFDPARGLHAYSSEDYRRLLAQYSDDRVRYYSDPESYQLLCQYRLLAAQRWQGFDEYGRQSADAGNSPGGAGARTRGLTPQPLHFYEHYQPWRTYDAAQLAAFRAFYRWADLAAVFAYHCAFYPLDPSFATLVRQEPQAQRAVLATNSNRPFCWQGTCNARSFLAEPLPGLALATLVEEPARFLAPDVGLPAQLTLTPLTEDGTPTAAEGTTRMGLVTDEHASRSVTQPRRRHPPTRAQLNRGDRVASTPAPDYGRRAPPPPSRYPPRTAPATDPLDAPATEGVGTGNRTIAAFLEELYTAAHEHVLDPPAHNSVALALAVYGPDGPFPWALTTALDAWQGRSAPVDESAVSALLQATAGSSYARYHALRSLGQTDPGALAAYVDRHNIATVDPLTLSRQVPDLVVALTILGSGRGVLPDFFAMVLPREEVAALAFPADDVAVQHEELQAGVITAAGGQVEAETGDTEDLGDGVFPATAPLPNPDDPRNYSTAYLLPRAAPWTGAVYRDAEAFPGADEDARLHPYGDPARHVNEDARLLDAGIFTDSPFDMEVADFGDTGFIAPTATVHLTPEGWYDYKGRLLARAELLDGWATDGRSRSTTTLPSFTDEEFRQLRWLAEDQGDQELADAVTRAMSDNWNGVRG